MGGKGSGGRNTGGQNRKSVAQHLLEGTYRADRHGPKKAQRARSSARRLGSASQTRSQGPPRGGLRDRYAQRNTRAAWRRCGGSRFVPALCAQTVTSDEVG